MNISAKLLVFTVSLLLFMYSCEKKKVEYQVGDIAEGGLVFYITDDGFRGLVVADTSKSRVWGCEGTMLIGAKGREVGFGKQNTIDIMNQCDYSYGAAKFCTDLSHNNYSDWYLPSLFELEQMRLNVGLNELYDLGGGYWTSSQYGSGYAWTYDYSNNWYVSSKSSHRGVVPIRSFGHWDEGCMDTLACNYDITANMNDDSCVFPDDADDCSGIWLGVEVRDNAFGGKVFYVDSTGEHGLVFSNYDRHKAEWGCNWTYLDASGTNVGSGYLNSQVLLNNCMENEIAVRLCDSHSDLNFNDWYMPSKDELELIMSLFSFNINGGIYYSSSEIDENNVWAYDHISNLDTMIIYTKSHNSYVIPIRSF